MELSSKQKEYIRKKNKTISVEEMAKRMKIDREIVENYFKTLSNKQKVGKKTNLVNDREIENRLKLKIMNFSFKRFFKKYEYYLWGLLVLTVLVFANSFDNEFLSDDIDGILKNEKINDLNYVFKGMAVLQNILYFLIVEIFGKNAFWFRLINNFLPHILMVWGVFCLIYLLFDEKAAFFCSALMAVHPVIIEPVIWISAGTYVRYSTLMVWGLIFYILSLKNQKNFWVAAILFGLSMMSSEKGVVFPAILILLWLCFRIYYKDWKKAVFFLGIPVISLIVIYLGMLQGRRFILKTDFYSGGQMTNPLIQIPVAISSYLGLIFCPDKLTLYHSELSFDALGASFIFIGFFIYLGLLIWGFLKNKKIFFGLAWFLVALSPTLTPFGVSWVVAERYVYLASVGIFLILGLLMSEIDKKVKYRSSLYLIFSFLLVAMIIRTIIRNNDWQNQDNLWLAAERTSPNSQQNHNNLGDLYARRGDYEKAIYHFKRAIELNPRYGDAYHNLANIYQTIGDYEKAIEFYEKAIEFNPKLWQSYQNLGAIYYDEGEEEKAMEYFKKCLEINPNNLGLKKMLSEFGQ